MCIRRGDAEQHHAVERIDEAAQRDLAAQPWRNRIGKRRGAEDHAQRLLRHLQRRVIRQHDAAGADADGRGSGGDVADHHRGRRARDAGHAVVLGQPVAAVAPALRVAREIEGIA